MTAFTQPVPQLPAADLERARDYHFRLLGFEPRWSFMKLPSLSRGDVAIFFRLTTGPIAPQTYWIHAPDLESPSEEMWTEGEQIVEPPADRPWAVQ